MDLKMKHSEIYNTLSSYQSKYLENKDTQNRDLAYTKIFSEVMQQQRRNELELYKKMHKMMPLNKLCRIRLRDF